MEFSYNEMEDAWWDRFRASCRVFQEIKTKGLDAFDDKGQYYDIDVAYVIGGMWGMFVSAEMFDKCIVLKELAVAYEDKFKLDHKITPLEPEFTPDLRQRAL